MALLVAFAATSCSDIAEDERRVYIDVSAKRVALIEDFTGQRCSNCPLATELIEELQKDYGEENVIAVGIHTPPLGFAGSASVPGLMTDEGKEYAKAWGVETQPTGMVNRKGGLKDRSAWSAILYDETQISTPVTIDLSVDYSDITKMLTIKTQVKVVDDIDAKLQLWLVQDNIVALQIMPDGSNNRQYVHNHVFRGAINGLWGEPLAMILGETTELEHSFSLDSSTLPTFAPAYVPEDCAVVAFVYDDKGVMQAAKKYAINKE